MEWVETTGKTVEEAKESALDQLGVDEEDAEFEIVEEAKSGLFGRVRREARVRARVQPKKPRPKADRRERRRRPPKGDKADKADKPVKAEDTTAEEAAETPAAARASRGKAAAASTTKKSTAKAARGGDDAAARRASANKVGNKAGAATATSEPAGDEGNATPDGQDDLPAAPTATRSRNGRSGAEGDHMSSETVSIDEQADIIEEFLEGLMDSFGLSTEIQRENVDEELLEVQVEAPDLGLLIGPKGQTLGAIQELSRTVLQRKATGVYEGRVRIDIGGYRNRRREALERFTESVAEQVRESGSQKVLEPMNPADRKVVHDTVNDLEGVSTTSEGTEPYRRVVIKPAE